MTARADILAGRAVILVNIQDTIDAQLRTIRGKMRAFTNSISEIGGDLFRGGLAGSVASFFPVKSFTDFQDSMLFVQAKLKDTGVDVRDLERYIRELGRTTSFTSKEVAEGAAVLAQAGLGLRVKPTLLPALDLARSARVDIETAGRIMANAMMAFDLAADKAPEVAAKLTTATRLGTTDLVLMAESLKYLQTTSRGLNIGFDETLALITQLSNVGMRGSLAGTSLNAALGNLAAKPVQIKEKLGLVFTPEDVRDPIKMFNMLRDATKDMDALERKAVMSSLFNIRGERAFGGILLQNLDDLDRIMQEIAGSTDEARKAAELLDSRLGGVWRRAKSAFEEMGLSIGETTEGPLSKFGEHAAKVFENLSHLAQANPAVVQTLLIIPPAAIAAGAGLLLLSTAMSKVIMLIGPLLSANAMIFKTIAAIVGTNVKIIKSGFDSLLIGGLYLNKNQGPNIPLLQGITSGFQLATTALNNFYTHFLRVSQRVSGSPFRIPWMDWGRQGRGPMPAFGYVPRLGYDPSISMRRDLPEAASSVAQTQRLLGRSVAGFLPDLRRSISTAVFRGFTHQDVIQRRLENQRGFQMVQPIQRLLEDNRRGLMVGRMPNVNRGAIIDGRVLSGSAQPVLSSWGKAGKAVRDAVLWVGRFIRSVSSKAFVGLAKVIQGIGASFRGLWAGIRAAGRGIANVNWLRVIISSTKGVLTVLKGIFTVLNGIRRFVFSLSGALLIVEALILFGDKIPVVKDILEGLGNAFKNVFSNIGQTLKNLVPSLSLIGDGIRNMFSGDAMLGVQKIKAAFSDIANTISTGLNHAWQQFVADIEPGASIIRNIINGLIGVFDSLVASVGSVFGTTIQGGKILVSADESTGNMLKSLFAPENFQSLFTFIVQLIGEIGKGLNSAVGVIFTALDAIKLTFASILKTLARIPGLGTDAQKSLESMDENAEIRKSLRIAIKNTEREWAVERRKLRPNLEIYSILQSLQNDLANLDFVTPIKINVEDQNNKLQAKIDSIIDGFGTMITPMAPNAPEAKAAADAAALAARFRPTALAIGNALGTPLAMLNSLLSPGDLGPRQPILIVPETGRKVGGGRGFDIMSIAEMQEAAANLIEGLKAAFTSQTPEPPDVVTEAKEQAAAIGQAVKAVVGDFESTRGQRLQFRSEKLQEKTNEILDAIQAGVEPLAGLLEKQPRFA